jgi:hypothetical protein
VFADAAVIVCPSSSCVAMMRDHYPKMAEQLNDPELRARVEAILPRVFEFSELLVDKLGVTDVGAFYPHTVTLHASCHALRSLHIGTKPAELLQQVKGLTLLELPDADQCCGFGGTFAVDRDPDVSAAMLSDKAQRVLGTKAEACTGADNSCLMHIGGALRQGSGPGCGRFIWPRFWPRPRKAAGRRPYERSGWRGRQRPAVSGSRQKDGGQLAAAAQRAARNGCDPDEARPGGGRKRRLAGAARRGQGD